MTPSTTTARWTRGVISELPGRTAIPGSTTFATCGWRAVRVLCPEIRTRGWCVHRSWLARRRSPAWVVILPVGARETGDQFDEPDR
jgi:hypothetical protein